MGRPRVYEDPEQIKLRAEASVKAQLKAKARSLGMTLTQFLMTAALSFNPVVTAALPERQEIVDEATTNELHPLPDRDEPLLVVSPHCPMPKDSQSESRPADLPSREDVGVERANSPISSVNAWQSLAPQLKVRVSEKNFEIWLSSVRLLSFDERRLVLQVPNTFFQEYLTEHYTEVIKEELLSKHNKPYEVEFVALPASPEVEKPAPVVTAPPPETDPVILELLRRDRELAEIDRTTRSINIANERRELSLQIHRRRMAEASAKLRAFDPDPEKSPTPKEIRTIAAELAPKNRNDHPWRKVLPPKRPK